MKQGQTKQNLTLKQKYPPSPSCSCDICVAYCKRPGWWTVKEATKAIEAGYAKRMMLELSPDRTFGVLSPAFKGNEGAYALKVYSDKGCTFLNDKNLCELFGTGFEPLECRFCHHDRQGLGKKCHLDIESNWNTKTGRELVTYWAKIIELLKNRPLGVIP